MSVGLPALALVIGFLGFLIARWQASIATEKLRYDLYDRRFSIYMAFHTLLVAILEKDDADAELRAANAARAHAPFLLNTKLVTYLQELHAEAFRIDSEGKQFRTGNLWPPSELGPWTTKRARERLMIVNKIDDLVKEFEPFIQLKDLANYDSFAEIILWGKALMRQLRIRAIRLLRELGLIENIPSVWQGKKRLAAEFGVPLSGLPFGGSDENILLAQNGVLLDERIREELKRRRERIARWCIPLRWVLWLKGHWKGH